MENIEYKLGKKFYDYKSQILRWIQFFDNDSVTKNKKILDYGTGPGWAIFVGRYLGYDIVGLDMYDHFSYGAPLMNKLRKVLQVTDYTILYDTKNFPFEDNFFDIIICKAVLVQNYKNKKETELELKRTLKDSGIIYVSPERHLKHIPTIDKKNKKILNIGIKNIENRYKDKYNFLCKMCRQYFLDGGLYLNESYR